MLKPKKLLMTRAEIAAFYEGKEYMAAYEQHTNMRVRHDPQSAIGGQWEEVGTLQLEYLIANGLEPESSLLDIGCGTLRGGRKFIAYLDSGRYTGFDMSGAAIQAGRDLVTAEGLTAKRPRLFVNKGGNLTFSYSTTYDFLFAQSVFTHLPSANIEEAFAHVGRVMKADSVFYFTFDDISKFQRTTNVFPYPFSFFQDLAFKYDLEVEARNDYNHPRGQSMAVLRKKSGALVH